MSLRPVIPLRVDRRKFTEFRFPPAQSNLHPFLLYTSTSSLCYIITPRRITTSLHTVVTSTCGRETMSSPRLHPQRDIGMNYGHGEGLFDLSLGTDPDPMFDSGLFNFDYWQNMTAPTDSIGHSTYPLNQNTPNDSVSGSSPETGSPDEMPQEQPGPPGQLQRNAREQTGR
jgi:hypothetical protein